MALKVSDLMKIELGCRPRVDDNAKRETAGGSQEELQQETDKQALLCKDFTLGSSFNAQKSFEFFKEEVLKDNATTARNKALQQAVCKGVRQAQRTFQQLQQQAQPQYAAVVGWKRFLPYQQLQVLLVEEDDATRHIVGALLRNCSYEVTPASNGLLAWELLMDQTIRADLVLTEVVMPNLSGIGLLGRIMNHDALKHVPVIMMSSHDSMNVVFKCLSMGAVDFLVKPLRKNELKNLWQHVWRRCHSSSGSKSGSGSRTQKTAGPKDASKLNHFGTNEDSDKTGSDLNLRGGSDNGSGTQSLWTKEAIEAESGRQVSEPHATGLRLNVGLQAVVKLDDHSSLGPELKDLKVGTSLVAGTAASVEDARLAGHKNDACLFSGGVTQRAADLVGRTKKQDIDEEQSEASDEDDDVDDDLLEKHASNSPSSKDKLSDSSFPSPNSHNILELSLKQPGEQEDSIRGIGGKALIHSSASAFSRYHSRGNFTPLIARMDPATVHIPQAGFGRRMPAQEGGNGGLHTLSSIVTSRKESITFCNNNATPKRLIKTKMEVKCLAQVCPPAKHGTLRNEDTPLPPLPPASCSFSASKQAGIALVVDMREGPQVGESGEAKDYSISYKEDDLVYSHTNNYQQYHHHSHHHHHHHHIQHHYYHVSEDKRPTRPETSQANAQTVTDIRDEAPRCRSSNMANGYGSNGNLGPSGSSIGYGSNGNATMSVNGSATGSNNGVQSAAVVLPIRGKDVRDPMGEDIGSPDINGAMGLIEKCSATREAARTKFRQKRKERCFEKKVRYQSRKRLAEQRPRVRGQFVKQLVHDPNLGSEKQANQVLACECK